MAVLGSSLIGLALLAITIVVVLAWPRRYRGRVPSVQVLVLGDVGRSPRMQYHALSIARHAPVQLIGYYETDLVDELARHPRLTKVPLTASPAALRRLPFVVGGPLKVLWQVAGLVYVLAYATRPARWLLVQNPPSIPTLAVAALVARLRGTRLLVDWHNYGWSILAGTRGAAHPFVGLARRYETRCGRLGHAHLAVTHAMAAQLRAPPYSLPPAQPLTVLHDRPAALFQPAPPPFPPPGRDRELVAMLAGDDSDDSDDSDNSTDDAVAALLAQPCARVVVSSTSWTPDEDFQLLLDALVQYMRDAAAASPQAPPILVVITGKGPQKAMYKAQLDRLAADGTLPPARLLVRTAFLPMRDYARLLALADLGVCLHMSSSGVDLPMKVVDMFGAGLPVAAYSAYESFGELVRDGVNGRGFTTAAELAHLLAHLLGPDPDTDTDIDSGPAPSELARLRAGAREESKLRWTEEWDRVVAPLLGLADEESPKTK